MDSRHSQPEKSGEIAPSREGVGWNVLEPHTEIQLRERVKELHCLAQLGRLVDLKGTLEELLQEAVRLLPPAFLSPDDAVARITLGSK